ncbi:S9 family peptidase [Sediminicola luteus]|uniref:S9 family peptidase n=1 Tax=Sediminicola luteus TaxID=319238 RepID=A0ABV2TTX3_9FLAO
MIPNRIPLFLLIISFAYPWMGDAQSDKKSVTIEELMQLKTVKNPVISPDGQWVAFTVAEMDLKKDAWETRIWMVPSKGGEAIPMTAKGYSASEPKWSSDNKYLSFLASKKEGDKTQVWTLNRQGGEAEQLTKIPQGVTSHEWSPKGRELMLRIKDPKPEELTEDKEDDKKAKPYVVDRLQFKQDYQGYLDSYRTHLYVMTIGDSIPRQITSGDFDDEDPVWSPDGTQIAFTSNRSDNPDGNSNTDIWIVNTANTNKGESLRQVTTNPNADFYPCWSPDGKHIVYRTVTDKKAIWYATQKLAIIPVDGGQPNLLAEALDRNISKPNFSDDGKLIYFILEESGTSILASIDPAGKNLKRVIQGDISISDYDLKGESIFPLLGKANQPYEVYNFTKSLKQLTSLNDGLLNKMEKPSIEKIHFKSADGTEIEGFVVKPIGFDASKKYPTILWLHGGPVSQYQFEYDIEPQLFASNGYVALLINPRGSSGYGQAFSEALIADWGNKDYQDVMAGVDYVIGQGYADPNKLGVGGWSYGGILTNYVITKTDRFKGAISGASEALYRSNYGHDHYQLTWELELGLPWENAEAWEKISPFNQVANITTPTLWIGGEKDWNVPILNSEQMYQAMKRLGRETQLVVYPGEHHGIKRPSFVKDRLERYLQWFKTYVEGEK